MTDDPAVDLLGHALIEAAVARLHVEHGDPPALGRDGGETAVRVAQDEHRVGADVGEDRVHPGDDLADGLGRQPPRGPFRPPARACYHSAR